MTTGNGNCLYNCISIWLTGNESLHVYLGVLTAIELYENAAFHVQHSKVLSVQSSQKVGEDTLFGHILSSNGTLSMNENTSVPDFVKFTAAVKDEAIGTCKLSEYATLVHIMALSSVIQYPIRSHYPDVKAVIPRPLFDAVYFPRKSGSCSSSNELFMIVFRSPDDQLDNTPNRKFEPNHFVLLQFADKESIGKRNERSENQMQVKWVETLSRQPFCLRERRILLTFLEKRKKQLRNPQANQSKWLCGLFKTRKQMMWTKRAQMKRKI